MVGRDPGVTVGELESWALPALDANRIGEPKAVVVRPVIEESVEIEVSWDGERLLRDPEGSLRLLVGPNPMGAFAKLSVGGDALAGGERIGPLNAGLMRFLDEELGAGFGPVEPALDVRGSHG
jgi:hypothetical protein